MYIYYTQKIQKSQYQNKIRSRNCTYKGAKKKSQNKLLEQLTVLEEHLQALPESFTNTEVLEICAKIKKQCKAYLEVLRLSESVVNYKLNESQDYFFKGLFV